MDPHENRLIGRDVTHHHRQMYITVDDIFIGDGAKPSIDSRQITLNNSTDQFFLPDPIPYKISDANHLQIVFSGKLLELAKPRHRTILVHDLADHTSGI